MQLGRRLLIALPVLALATGAGAAGSLAGAAGGTPVPRTAPACTNGQLVNWLNTSGNGYAGGVEYQLQFTNISTHACSLFGFPGVSAVNLAGHQLGAAARRSGNATTRATIAAGGHATAALQIVDTGNFSPSACRAVTAAGLRVYAPNLTSSEVIPFPFSVCSRASTVSLGIQAVR